MPILNANNIRAPVRAFSGCMPTEGPLAVPMRWEFSTTVTQWVADLQSFVQQQNISYIQSVFVNNADNDAEMMVLVPSSGQRMRIPAYSQCYLALLAPNPPYIEFLSTPTATVQVECHLCNFPVDNEVWSLNANGALAPVQVSDVALDALLVNGYLPVLAQGVGNGGVHSMAVPTASFTLSKTTTASQTLVAGPGAGFSLWIESISLSLLPTATMAVAGANQINILPSVGARIAVASAWVDNAATAIAMASVNITHTPRVKLGDNVALNATLNTALTAGAWEISGTYAIIPT